MAKKNAKKQIIVETKGGKKIRLLTPDQKGAKAAVELKRGVRLTNFGQVKRNKNGSPQKLTKAQRSYRAGCLNARSDNAKAYVHNKAKRAAKRAATSR